MIKLIVKFVGLMLAFAVVGLVLSTVGALSSGGGELTTFGITLLAVGSVLVFISPALAGLALWVLHRRSNEIVSKQAKEASEKRQAVLRRRFLERQRLIDATDRHRIAVTRNLQRALKINDYGAVTSDTRQDALEEFFASIALDTDLLAFAEASALVFEQLDIRDAEDRQIGFDADILPFDGTAFEAWTAEALKGFGWEVDVTQGGGDQGIDVIAKKDGKIVGLQCKLYSSAIGNKAVQEAHAGKAYYNADEVGVISNADYTSSAKDLALATGVFLLSHRDIPELYEKLFERGR